ncbi:hypothetical protein WAB17_07540 [Parerythrobacter aurantius]|uniref:hypothetical protein n=1 Tax=Parerythrobacter aurantius TaxID=3127706 RepID=UPI0032503443
MTRRIALLPVVSVIALTGCASAPQPADSQDVFWTALAGHCGKAYAGALVSDDAADAAFRGASMVMHVRSCDEREIRVPFHVQRADGSWDRSRTWVLTRTESGLRLKHDHRHEDGTGDAVTMYGGDTADEGTRRSQSFPVDAESIAMFEGAGLPASVTNVWTVEVDPAGSPEARFAYQLRRTIASGAPADRLFRVEFDTTRPVAVPPAPWGS